MALSVNRTSSPFSPETVSMYPSSSRSSRTPPAYRSADWLDRRARYCTTSSFGAGPAPNLDSTLCNSSEYPASISRKVYLRTLHPAGPQAGWDETRGGTGRRVVNVASAGQSPVDFDDVLLERGYDGMKAYTQSKLAQVMFTFDMAERLWGTGVTTNALHPASLMDTKMVLETFGRTMSTVQEGAEATVRLAVSPELEGVTGRYFDGTREGRANAQAYDREARKRLWALSEELCKKEEN